MIRKYIFANTINTSMFSTIFKLLMFNFHNKNTNEFSIPDGYPIFTFYETSGTSSEIGITSIKLKSNDLEICGVVTNSPIYESDLEMQFSFSDIDIDTYIEFLERLFEEGEISLPLKNTMALFESLELLNQLSNKLEGVGNNEINNTITLLQIQINNLIEEEK